MTLVRASWAMRYAARPTPAETGRGSPSTRRSTDQAGFGHLGDEHREIEKPGSRCDQAALVVVGAKHREELAHLAHRRSRRLLDRGQRLERLSRVFGADQPSRASLDRHHAHRVREDIVQLPGDPQPFLDDCSARSLLSLTLQVHRPLLELGDEQPTGPHIVAEQPRAGDDEQRRGIGGAGGHGSGDPRDGGGDDQDQAGAPIVQAGSGEVDDERDGGSEGRRVQTSGVDQTAAESDSQRHAARAPAERDRCVHDDDERHRHPVGGPGIRRPVGAGRRQERPAHPDGDDRHDRVDGHQRPGPGSMPMTIRHLCDGTEAPIGGRHSRAVLASHTPG